MTVVLKEKDKEKDVFLIRHGDNMNKKFISVLSISCCIIVFIGFCIIVFIGLFLMNFSNKNDLNLNEIKAYFKHTIFLDYHPDIDEIYEVQIGGAINLSSYDATRHGNAIYNKKHNIEQITNYLNLISLVEATEDELPNKSPDSYIQYFDNNGQIVGSFIIYGQIFIKDIINKKLYRIKKTKTGIVKGLEDYLNTSNTRGLTQHVCVNRTVPLSH